MTLDDVNVRFEQSARARTFVHSAMIKAHVFSYDEARAALEGRGVRASDIALLTKAPVAAHTMADALGDPSPFAAAFLRLVAQRSAFGQIPFRPAPFNVRTGIENPGATASWVAEGQPIPVAGFDLDPALLVPGKLGLIVAISRELTRSADPAAAATIEAMLTRIVAESTDAAAFDPTVTESLSFGATEITATADPNADIAALLAAISGGSPSRPHLVLGMGAARTLAFSGELAFDDVQLVGAGSIAGVPALPSPAPALSSYVIAVDADAVLLADAGITVDPAQGATLQMSSTPTGGAGNRVSLFQSNLDAYRVIRYLAWDTRDDAVAFIDLGGSPA